MAERFWSISEFRRQTGISRSTAYSLVHRADFPSVRLGEKRIVIPVDDFYTWLADQRRQQKEIEA